MTLRHIVCAIGSRVNRFAGSGVLLHTKSACCDHGIGVFSMGMLLFLGLPLLLIGGLLLDGFGTNDLFDRFTNRNSGDSDPDVPDTPDTPDTTQQGTDGADLLTGTSAGEDIFGNAGDDTLMGLGGDDSLFGGTGMDSISGGGGQDMITGGFGGDNLAGDSGADTLYGGGGSDMVYGGRGDDFADGGAGNDLISGGAGNDTISGRADDDVIYGDAGNDMLAGDSGDDWIYDVVGRDSLYGGTGDDALVATTYNGLQTDLEGDVLYGGLGSDLLVGDAGFAVGGADTMTGGDGADFFEVQGVSAESGRVVEPAVVTDFTSEDSLFIQIPIQTGTSEVELLTGADGTEVRIDGVTYVMLLGNTDVSPDQVTFQGAEVLGTRFVGTEGNDVMYATTAISSSDPDPEDVLLGLGGDDTLIGVWGSVTLRGADGDDVLVGGTASDELLGGLGDDVIVGSSAQAGPGGAPDLIFGGFGEDTIFAGSGDTVSGGANDDVFALFGTQENVVITDFVPGSDVIEYLDNINATAQAISVRSMAALGGTEVLYGSLVIAQLQGVAPADFIPARDISVRIDTSFVPEIIAV